MTSPDNDTYQEQHGTRSAYVHGRCRCDSCREANRAYLSAYQRERGRRSWADYSNSRRRHPSLWAYRHGCRCAGCRRWNAADQRYYAEKRAWKALFP